MYTGKIRIPTNRFCFKCHPEFFTVMSRDIHMCVRIAMKICIALKHIRKERKAAMSILL